MFEISIKKQTLIQEQREELEQHAERLQKVLQEITTREKRIVQQEEMLLQRMLALEQANEEMKNERDDKKEEEEAKEADDKRLQKLHAFQQLEYDSLRFKKEQLDFDKFLAVNLDKKERRERDERKRRHEREVQIKSFSIHINFDQKKVGGQHKSTVSMHVRVDQCVARTTTKFEKM